MGAALSWMDRMCVMLFLASCSRSLASDTKQNKHEVSEHAVSCTRTSMLKKEKNDSRHYLLDIPLKFPKYKLGRIYKGTKHVNKQSLGKTSIIDWLFLNLTLNKNVNEVETDQIRHNFFFFNAQRLSDSWRWQHHPNPLTTEDQPVVCLCVRMWTQQPSDPGGSYLIDAITHPDWPRLSVPTHRCVPSLFQGKGQRLSSGLATSQTRCGGAIAAAAPRPSEPSTAQAPRAEFWES